MKYFACITKQKPGLYLVEFPELKGCLTEGRTLKDAKQNAVEALNGWLASNCDRNLNIPHPKIRKSANYHPIEVDLHLALAIVLRKVRKAKKLSQAQIAKELNITQQAYAKLEIPSKTNPLLSTLKKLSEVLDIKFYFDSTA